MCMVSVQFSGQSFERLVPGGLSTGKFWICHFLAAWPDKSLTCSDPQFSYLWNGMDNNFHMASSLGLLRSGKVGCAQLHVRH